MRKGKQMKRNVISLNIRWKIESSTMGIIKQNNLIRKKMGRKLLLVLIAMLMIVKLIIFHLPELNLRNSLLRKKG